MEQRDRFGNWINDQTYRKLCQYAMRLTDLGYQEAQSKANLFYRNHGTSFENETGNIAFFMNMRGTSFLKIWEDSRPIFGWVFQIEMPKWAKRRHLQAERERFLEHNIPYRIVHLNEVHPDDTETLTMPFAGPDGYCRTCGADFRGEGYYCSTDCEQTGRPEKYCSACETQLTREERIRHHTSYFPEDTVTVCRSCHTRIHQNPEYHPELTPPKDEVHRFYNQ